MSIFTGIILVDLFGFVVALFAVIYAIFKWNFQKWEKKNIPYFQPIFPYGNREPYRKDISIGDEIFNIVAKAKQKGWKYFGLFLNASPFFVALDFDILKHILIKDFNNFTDRGVYYNEKDDPLSAHLFSIGGKKWRNLRTKLTPTFTSGKMRGMFQTVIDCGSVLEKHMMQYDHAKPVDIKDVLSCYSTDIIGSCAFGLDCNSFTDPDSPFLKYGRKIFSTTKYEQLVSILANAFPKLAKAIHVKTVPTDVSKFFRDVVNKTISYREEKNVTRKDFLQILLELKNANSDGINKGDGTSLTVDEIAAQCFVFFLAGFETSSTTMTFALYELSTNPEIQEKVREELQRVLKKYDDKICYDSLKDLEYMQQVIDETLRKYPPVPFVTRQCMDDYKIPNSDVTLDKGTNVVIPIRSIHYFEDVYPNPTVFDPERFSPENKLKRSPFAHLPFGEGPRICIGARFGIMQTKVGLATVLKNFRVKLSSKTETPLVMDHKSFIASTKGGIWLNLEKI